MKTKSSMFLNSKPGTFGRRATRWLNDYAVAIASAKSKDIKHQMKFMSPGKRMATCLKLLDNIVKA